MNQPRRDWGNPPDELASRAFGITRSTPKSPPGRDARNRRRSPTLWTSTFKVWLGRIKVWPPTTLAQARSFFDRALTADPDNVDALDWIGARGRGSRAHISSRPIRSRPSRRPKRKLTKALSSVPDHALGHMFLGLCRDLSPSAPRRASPSVNMRWRLTEILSNAHAHIGLGKILIGRAEETEAHVVRGPAPQSARYGGLYLDELCGHREDLPRQLGASGRVVSAGDRGQPKLSASYILRWPPRSAQLGRLDEARSAVKAGLALNPTFTVSRARAAWTAMSDNPDAISPRSSSVLDGMRKAEPPEECSCAHVVLTATLAIRRRRHSRPMGVGGASRVRSSARAYTAQRNDAFPPTECRPLAAIRDGRFTSIRDVAQTSQTRK